MESDCKSPAGERSPATRRTWRRFLQYRLRSLFLLTLVVACWLGWEVHQAKTVERQVVASLGLHGNVEFETNCWSLLRFYDKERYGRRIVSVGLTCDTLDDAIDALKSMADLWELKVGVTGTSDVRLDWLRSELPLATVGIDDGVSWIKWDRPLWQISGSVWTGSRDRLCCERFSRKLDDFPTAPPLLVQSLKDLTTGNLWPWHEFPDFKCRVLPDGSVAEWLIVRSLRRFDRTTHPNSFDLELSDVDGVVLLVNDFCVDARWFHRPPYLYAEDYFDEQQFGPVDNNAAQFSVVATFTGDWNETYRVEKRRDDFFDHAPLLVDASKLRSRRFDYVIEPTGFRCLQPNDPFKN